MADSTPREIPADRYRSTAWHDLESQHLWPKVWQIACSEDCVPEIGDVYEYRIGSLSILLVRGDDEQIRGFQNACRHRGNALVDGAESGLRELRCAYHGWCYDLRGHLRSISEDGSGSARPGRSSLIPVQVGCFGGLVFVNPDLEAEPLESFLEELPRELAWVGMERYSCRHALSVEVECNWKVVIDAFIETYHLHVVHPQMLAIADDVHTPITLWDKHTMFEQPYGVASPRLEGRSNDQEMWEEFVRNLGHRLGRTFAAGDEPGPHPPVPEGQTLQDVLTEMIRSHLSTLGDPYPHLDDRHVIHDFHYHIFPNAVFNVFAGWFGLIRARPGSRPDRAILDMWNFDLLPEDHPESHARPRERVLPEHEQASLGPVMLQDLENFPRIQKGLSQPGLRTLRLVAAEARIGRMHQILDRYLGTSVEAEVEVETEAQARPRPTTA